MVDFKSLKKSRGAGLDKLTDQLAKLAQPGGSSKDSDNRFWKPEVDKAGNGYAVIRFLPAAAGEDVPFVRVFDHAFKGPGGWLIDGCLTTIGEKCPVCEHNSALWATGSKDAQDVVRKQKRKLSFIANIYVVKDPTNPENEGKVFLYKFGKKIFDKLNAAMSPEFEDEEPMNPFDLWAGANFKIKIRKVEGYQNYDKSEFDSPSALLDDDGELESIWKQEHLLQPFVAADQFKSYGDIQARLNKVLAMGGAAPQPTSRAESFDDDEPSAPPPSRPVKAAKPVKEEAPPWDDQEEDDMAAFQSLADD
jgi:gp32 DNA binding protein like